MGTRCTWGGEAPGVMPKKRLRISENGSWPPNEAPKGDIVMVAVRSVGNVSHPPAHLVRRAAATRHTPARCGSDANGGSARGGTAVRSAGGPVRSSAPTGLPRPPCRGSAVPQDGIPLPPRPPPRADSVE
ncbi:hypothetical protein ACE1SV_54170 [Streptomyces sennicomposti]